MKKIVNSLISCITAYALLLLSIPMNIVHGAEKETKLIALTFDDGPNTTTTNDVLDVLEQYNAKASFFLIGNNINEESAKSVKRAYDMGCEINNHSRTHSYMGSMSSEEIMAEIEYVDEKVVEITGEHTKFFRPPYIDVSQTMYDNIDLPFICGIDCKDYMEEVTAQDRADQILSGAKDGVIVLLHDLAGNSQTVDALKIIMPELINQGYEFVTLSELFERQGETPKHNMMYSEVAKYPCDEYVLHRNIFKGEAVGESSWSGWSTTAPLDAAELKSLGNSYAIEVDYECSYPPVIALQKWTGDQFWHPIQPFYYNGEKACFLASDVTSALNELNSDYAEIDRMTIIAYGGTLKVTNVDILVKDKTISQFVKGDVNNDGEFSIADLVMMQQFLLGNGTMTNWKSGDLCEDERIDVFDLVMMRKLIITQQ